MVLYHKIFKVSSVKDMSIECRCYCGPDENILLLREVRSRFIGHKNLCFLQIERLERMILNLNSVNQLILVMVKCGVLFEVRTEFLNNI
jgi:hypothetical protein